MIKRLKNRLKNDSGNAVIILGFVMILALMVVGGTVTDVSKAYQVKASQTEAARKATQAGIRIQTSDGFLERRSILETVRVYNNITRPSVIRTDPTTKVKKSHFERCGSFSDGDLAPREMVVWLSQATNSSVVSPEIVFDLDSENVETQNWVNEENTLKSKLSEIDYSRKYDTININIIETTPNAILPLKAEINRSNGTKYEKNGCQRIPIKASASTFLGKTDDYN